MQSTKSMAFCAPVESGRLGTFSTASLERMRKTLKLFGLVVLAVVAFAAGAATAVIRGWGDRAVHTQVINKSGQLVQSFTVRYTTCGSKTDVVGGPLSPGQSQTLRFPVCGEGVYVVEATLANGSVVKGAEGYIESRYSTTDTVTSKGVDSTQSLYAL